MVNGIADRLPKLGGESRPSTARWASGLRSVINRMFLIWKRSGSSSLNGNGGPDIARKQLDLTQTIADKHDITNQLLGILTAKDFGALVNN